MHKLILGLAAAGGLAALMAQPAAAQEIVYPWCAASPTIGTQCAFRTFEQCQADIFGLGGVCTTNPDYVAPMRRAHR